MKVTEENEEENEENEENDENIVEENESVKQPKAWRRSSRNVKRNINDGVKK